MDRRLAAVVLFYALLAGAGLLWMAWRGDPLPSALLGTQLPWPASVSIGAVTAALVVWLSDVALDRFAWTERLRDEVVEVLGPMTTGRAWAIAIASGVGEELLFRGALLPFAGLVGSSLVFGLLHTGPRLLGWTAFAVAAGFLFGGLAVFTGGVLAPAVAHVGVNATQLLRLRSLRTLNGDGAFR